MTSKSLSLSAGPTEDFLKDNITALKAREIFLGSLFSQEMFLRPPEMQYVFVIFFLTSAISPCLSTVLFPEQPCERVIGTVSFLTDQVSVVFLPDKNTLCIHTPFQLILKT